MRWSWFEPVVRRGSEFLEDLWFDWTRGVRTAGNLALHSAGLPAQEIADGEIYQPARPRHIRQALLQLPLQELSGFSFIDLGSGKGRTLFVAAAFPFRRVVGVEFSPLMHAIAVRNLRTFRRRRQRCGTIETVQANAKDFAFPDGDLVLYLFNPFGRGTMRVVLSNLVEAIRRAPRQVVVVLLWPRCEDMVAAIDGMELTSITREHQIFRLSLNARTPDTGILNAQGETSLSCK